MKNLYKKSALFFVVLLTIVLVIISFLISPDTEALTETQAERRADQYCTYTGAANQACKDAYKAGATGKPEPDWCKDKDSDSSCKQGYNEGKKANGDSKDSEKRNEGDKKEAEVFCKDQIGGRKQMCEMGYVAGLKGEKSPCSDGDGGKPCREGFNEGKKQRRQNAPKRSDCDDSNKPEECKKAFDKCDQLQGPNIAKAVEQCKVNALKSFPDENREDQPDGNVDCDTTWSSPPSWIICPLIDLGVDMTDNVFQNIIVPMLENVPVTPNPKEGVYIAWQQFRIIANVLLVGSLLIIVYSQARGGK